MGIYSYGYKAAKTPIGKKVVDTVKNIFTGGKQKATGTEVINKVDPFVPQTKAEISARDLRRATQKRKTSEVKLDNTLFRIKQEKDKLEKMKTQKKAKGGRVGLRLGSRKSNLQKIQEAFGPKQTKKKDKVKRMMAKKGSPNPKKKKKFPDLTGDGKVTFADILKGRGVINGKKKKNKKKFI